MKSKSKKLLCAIIAIVIAFGILQTVPYVAQASAEDMAQAYRSILSNTTLYGDLPVVFKDVCGDDLPEMIIWCRGENPSIGETDLQIWGYKNGASQKLLSLKWLLVSGASHQLYLMNDGRLAWLYTDLVFAEYYISMKEVKYYSLDSSGVLEQTGAYSYDVGYPDNWSEVEIFEGGTVNGKSVGEEEAKAADTEMQSNIVEQIYPAQIGGMSRAEAQSYLYNIGESQPAPTLNLDKYVGKWYTYNDWKEEVGDLSISKRGNTYILNCNFYRLSGIYDAIITGRADGTASFAEQTGGSQSISGTLSFGGNQITMILDDFPNAYFNSSLTRFFNGATHIFRIKDGDNTHGSFQHTIKSHPDEDRDFTFNENEEIEDLVFSTTSKEYNPRLAHFLSCMARAAYTKDQLQDNYDELGFYNTKYYHYNDDKFAGAAIAKRQLADGRLMVFISIRGSSSGAEWLFTNFSTDLIDNNLAPSIGLHKGFYNCEEELYRNISDYFNGQVPTQNVTYVITGHSLGGAVGNLISLKLFKKGVPSEALYNYNFACPLVGAGTDNADLWNTRGFHNNIININNRFDIVPSRPNEADYDIFTLWHYGSKGWTSFKRFGVSYWFDNGWAHFIDAHNMCAYIDYLARELDKSHFISTEYYVDTVSVHCPVDVIIIDSHGNPIAGTENNEPNYYGYEEGKKAIITVNGDYKTFQIMNSEKLEVRMLATDDGEMEYIYCRHELVSGNTLISKQFGSVKLASGKEIVSFVGGEMNAEDIKLFIEDGTVITHEILEDGTEIALNQADDDQLSEPSGTPEEEAATPAVTPEEKNADGSERKQNKSLLIVLIAVPIILLLAAVVLAATKKKK